MSHKTDATSSTNKAALLVIVASCAFLIAQLLHWSGILCLISCGLVQKHYGMSGNLSVTAAAWVDNVVGFGAILAETTVFLILGIK